MYNHLDDDGTAQIIQDHASYPQEPVHTEEVQEKPVQKDLSEKEYNLRYLRERAEAAERRASELERTIQNNLNQQGGQKIELEDEDLDVSDDMYIEGKQYKKHAKKMQKELKDNKRQMEELNQRIMMSNAELKLKTQFNDFEKVVTEENLSKLASSKPALYRTIMSNPDMYDKGYTAYEMIKAARIGVDQYEQQDKRLAENLTKPRSLANEAPQASDTPLARVGDYDRRVLTEADKARINRNVAEYKSYR